MCYFRPIHCVLHVLKYKMDGPLKNTTYHTLTNISMKYIVMYKVYTDVGGIKIVILCLSTCTQDNPLAKARGLSPRTGEHPMV